MKVSSWTKFRSIAPLLAVLGIITAFPADSFAQRRGQQPPPPSSSWNSGSNDHRISAGLGFVGYEGARITIDKDKQGGGTPLSGLFALGVEYEYALHPEFAVGGMFRFGSTSDDTTLSDNANSKVTSSYTYWGFGPMARFYVPLRKTEMFVGTGFLLGSPSGKVTQGTTDLKLDATIHFLPFINLGAYYNLTESFAVGFDTTRIIAVGSQVHGWLQSDYLIKGRFAF